MEYKLPLSLTKLPPPQNLVQGCSISIANAMEIHQPCSKPDRKDPVIDSD